MNEAELVLATLTSDELDEASRWVASMDAHWRAMTKEQASMSGFVTDGPWHLMTAMRLGIQSERAIRWGAAPWYVGEPTRGHPSGRMLEHYQTRLTMNVEPHQRPDGHLVQTCVGCGKAKVLSETDWDRSDGVWAVICRSCDRARPDKLVDAEMVEFEAAL